MKLHNNCSDPYGDPKLPSLNQIEGGLIAEAMLQLTLAMGKVSDQRIVFKAKNNIKKTWEELLAGPDVKDRNQPLKTWGELYNADSPVVALMLFIY